GQTYTSIDIGNQTWLGQNMNYATDGGASYCYANDTANCDTYGRLYTFAAAATACPPGWSLPSDQDWKTLETTLGMASNQLDVSGENTTRGTNQGTQIKVGGSSGFNAKFAGYATGPDFQVQGSNGYFWTSTEVGGEIWRRHIDGQPYLFRFENPPATFAISVRCLKTSN